MWESMGAVSFLEPAFHKFFLFLAFLERVVSDADVPDAPAGGCL